MIRNLREASSKGRTGLNIASAMINDDDDTASVGLLTDVLSAISVNANLVIADEHGIHWRAIREAAKLIKQVSERSPHGDGNFNFAAIAMMKPYGPYYPGSYHLGKGHAFAIAMEGADVVARVFAQYHDPREAEQHLSETLSKYTKEAEAVATQIASSTGWTYEGIDATPAPLKDNSIGDAIESFIGAPFGSSGTLTASGIITSAVQSTSGQANRIFRPDASGDGGQRLARRWAEGTLQSRFDSGVLGGMRGGRRYRSAARRRYRRADQPAFWAMSRGWRTDGTSRWRRGCCLHPASIPARRPNFPAGALTNTTVQSLPGVKH